LEMVGLGHPTSEPGRKECEKNRKGWGGEKTNRGKRATIHKKSKSTARPKCVNACRTSQLLADARGEGVKSGHLGQTLCGTSYEGSKGIVPE